MGHDYPPPLDRLVRLGEPDFGHTRWMDYPARFGLCADHVPDLVRMLVDEELSQSDGAEGYAIVHAWRALAQLRAEDAVPALLEIIRHGYPDEDWITEDLPTVFRHIGRVAFDPLVALFRDRALPEAPRLRAASGLTDVATAVPDLRDEAVRVLTRALDAYTPEADYLNGGIVADLVTLGAIESLPSIRRAYDEGRVDEIYMDLDEVEAALGLKPPPRTTPRIPPSPPPADDGRDTSGKRLAKKSRKQKRRK